MDVAGMSREQSIDRLRRRSSPWDLAVIGGGATGVAIALDAASRGLEVVLLEQSDFGKGTSSRSTKLIHGGVRYLRQGNITLVRDALRERSLLRDNAPHLVHDMPFLIPCRSYWQRFFYGVGLKVYDFLAVGNSFGRSRGVSAGDATRLVSALRGDRLRGGVVYHDGQFDDARLLINMARTACDQGACLLNYAPVTGLLKQSGTRVAGVSVTDQETGEPFEISARGVINAAGPFCDAVRQMDDAGCETMIAPSQGVHLVLPRSFFPGQTAMIVPKTSDGRVIFVIPWHDHAIVGTTDTPIPRAALEPAPRDEEIQFLLETTAEYLANPPTIDDVLSIYTGIRPLVKGDQSARTASLSRDHVIRVARSGLLTITGGKWTTVRKMAEDCVDRAIDEFGLTAAASKTKSLPIHGAPGEPSERLPGADDPRDYYGTDVSSIRELEQADDKLATVMHESLPIRHSDVVWSVRNEMARTVEDVLARRTRVLFLNAHAAIDLAPVVARLMAGELKRDEHWCHAQVESFAAVARNYLPLSG